jgi:hypothetical protein
LEGRVGDKIYNHASSAQCSVDKYGQKYQTAAGAKGDAKRTLHGVFLATLAHLLRQAGVTFYGGGRINRSSKDIFWHLMQTFEGADERAQKKLNGILADMLVNLSIMAASPRSLVKYTLYLHRNYALVAKTKPEGFLAFCGR